MLENQRRVIIGEETQTEIMEKPDILADQRAMQCPDWVRAQDADSVIKRLKVIMEEFGRVAPNKAQFNSELAEVKSLCRHWNLLEIVNTRVERSDRSSDLRTSSARGDVY